MEEYEEDAEFKWIGLKKVDKNDVSLWRTFTVPEGINFYLLKRNQLHFGQSEQENTPFTTETMKRKFNWNVSTKEAEDVLKGEYEDDENKELNKVMQLVLKNCIRIVPMEKSNPEITVLQLRGKIKVWRKSTSTSPSGQHLGHYK